MKSVEESLGSKYWDYKELSDDYAEIAFVAQDITFIKILVMKWAIKNKLSREIMHGRNF